MMRSCLVLFTLVSVVFCQPINSNNSNDDVQIVESTIREVRAAAPGKKKVWSHKYGDESDGSNTHGYHRRSKDQGSNGYEHYDAFHKKGGDKYAYESHSAFGKEAGGGKSNAGHSGKYSEHEDHDGAGDESKNTYSVVEHVDEDGGNYDTDGGSSSGHYYSEGSKDSDENGHYTDAGHDDEDDKSGGHYEKDDYISEDGSSGHYTDAGNSGYSFGGDADGDVDGGKSEEHYESAAEDYDAY